MKAEDSQQTTSRENHPTKVDREPWAVDPDRSGLRYAQPWNVLTTDNVSRAPLQPEKRQVRVVYRRWNFAGKLPFLATFGDAQRAFQVAIPARHVVAAT